MPSRSAAVGARTNDCRLQDPKSIESRCRMSITSDRIQKYNATDSQCIRRIMARVASTALEIKDVSMKGLVSLT